MKTRRAWAQFHRELLVSFLVSQIRGIGYVPTGSVTVFLRVVRRVHRRHLRLPSLRRGARSVGPRSPCKTSPPPRVPRRSP